MEKPRMPEERPPVGVAVELAPGVRRIIAPNASPMTYWGTNTYILGAKEVMVLDPGPKSPEHLTAILKALGGAKVSHVLVTHSHLDHSPLARDLSDAVSAPVCAFGDSGVGKTDVMRALESNGMTGGGEGVDKEFVPDQIITHAEMIRNPELAVKVHHTPGHMGNHISFEWNDQVFSGDVVMGWASTMVSPPEGDLSDFLASCETLKALNAHRFYPGHGGPIEKPTARIDWLIAHRAERTTQIFKALKSGPSDIPSLTKKIYVDAPSALLDAAARNVFAHLIELEQLGQVSAHPALGPDANFSLIES